MTPRKRPVRSILTLPPCLGTTREARLATTRVVDYRSGTGAAFLRLASAWNRDRALVRAGIFPPLPPRPGVVQMITKRDTRIPRRPLLWLAAALLFVLPPMFDRLAVWVPTLLLSAVATKFWMEPRGYRLRFLPLKLALVVAAVVTNLHTLRCNPAHRAWRIAHHRS